MTVDVTCARCGGVNTVDPLMPTQCLGCNAVLKTGRATRRAALEQRRMDALLRSPRGARRAARALAGLLHWPERAQPADRPLKGSAARAAREVLGQGDEPAPPRPGRHRPVKPDKPPKVNPPGRDADHRA